MKWRCRNTRALPVSLLTGRTDLIIDELEAGTVSEFKRPDEVPSWLRPGVNRKIATHCETVVLLGISGISNP